MDELQLTMQRIRNFFDWLKTKLADIFKGKTNYYGKIEEKLDEIEMQLDILEELSKDDKISKDILNGKLKDIEGILEYATNIKLTENNVDDIKKDLNKLEDSLNKVKESIDTASDFKDQTEKFFYDLTPEELENAEGFVNSSGLFISTPKGVKHLYYSDTQQSMRIYPVDSIKETKDLRRIAGLNENLVELSKLPNVEEKAKKFQELCYMQLYYHLSGEIEKNKKYIDVVNKIIGNGEKVVSTQTKYGQVDINKDFVRINTEKGLSTLRYNNETNSIVLYHNDKLVAEWYSQNNSLMERVEIKQDKLDLTKELNNPYVYALFEAHGIKRKYMEHQIKHLGESDETRMFGYVPIEKTHDFRQALTKLEKSKLIETPSYTNDKALNVSRCSFMYKKERYAVSFKPTGEVLNVYKWPSGVGIGKQWVNVTDSYIAKKLISEMEQIKESPEENKNTDKNNNNKEKGR